MQAHLSRASTKYERHARSLRKRGDDHLVRLDSFITQDDPADYKENRNDQGESDAFNPIVESRNALAFGIKGEQLLEKVNHHRLDDVRLIKRRDEQSTLTAKSAARSVITNKEEHTITGNSVAAAKATTSSKTKKSNSSTASAAAAPTSAGSKLTSYNRDLREQVDLAHSFYTLLIPIQSGLEPLQSVLLRKIFWSICKDGALPSKRYLMANCV